MYARFAASIVGLRSSRLAAAVIFLAATTTLDAAHAEPISGLFNTGVEDDGITLLSAGANDLHYTVSGPGGGPIPVVGYLSPSWRPQGPDSNWIVPNSEQPGDYTWKIDFDLAGCDPDIALIEGQWITDNDGTDILINGISTGQTSPGSASADFRVFTDFVIDSGFQVGGNTLEFIVNNQGGPTGLRVEMSGTAACRPLDHMTCYRIKPLGHRQPSRDVVVLSDQFGEIEARVIRPELLCVPSAKELK